MVMMVLEDDPGECPHCLLLPNSNSKFEALSMLIFCWSIGGPGFLLAVTTTQILRKLSSSEDEKYGYMFRAAKFIRSKCLVWLHGGWMENVLIRSSVGFEAFMPPAIGGMKLVYSLFF